MTFEVFSLTPAALEGELWRLWTGHLVHYDFRHLAFNVLAALPPFAVIGRRARVALVAQLAVIAPLLSLVLLFVGGFNELRGATGLIIAAWCGAGLILLRERRRLDGMLFLAAIVVKLAVDRFHLLPLGTNAQTVSIAAHAGGAMLALILAPLIGPRALRKNAPGGEDAAQSQQAEITV